MKRCLLLFIAFIIILVGCEDPENPGLSMLYLLEIQGLSISEQAIRTGEETTVTALVDYSGQTVDLVYKWQASAGTIAGESASATYQAPDAAGNYTITLKVTDGFVTDEESITVKVVDHMPP